MEAAKAAVTYPFYLMCTKSCGLMQASQELTASLKILIDDPVGVIPECPIQFPAVTGIGHTLQLQGSGISFRLSDYLTTVDRRLIQV